jgi:hypothetical protein
MKHRKLTPRQEYKLKLRKRARKKAARRQKEIYAMKMAEPVEIESEAERRIS